MNNVGTIISDPTDQKILERINDACIFESHVDVDKQNGHFQEINQKIRQWKLRDENDHFVEARAKLEISPDDEQTKTELQTLESMYKVFKYMQSKSLYDIRLEEESARPQNTGQIYIYAHGVVIKYPTPATENPTDAHIRNHISIAHELGHVLVNCPSFYHDHNDVTRWIKEGAQSGEMKPRFNHTDEVTASRCAEWILSFIAKKCEDAKEAGVHILLYLNVESEKLFNEITDVMKNNGYQVEMPEYDLIKYGVATENRPVDRSRIP